MKIMYCIPSLASKGGTERVLISKANALANKGYDVVILVSEQKFENTAYPLASNVKVIDVNISQYLSADIKGLSFFNNVKKLKKVYFDLIKTIAPDIIIVVERGYEDFIIPHLSINIPIIREYHSSRKASSFLESTYPFRQRVKSKIIRILYEKQYRKYDAFVCLTEKDKSSWRHIKNVLVIPNMLLDDPHDKNISILDRPKRLIAVGSMVADRKGFTEMIEAWASIAAVYPDWQLHIFGDGPYKEVYAKQIQELNVEKQVILEGITDTIEEEYQKSSIFLMTSKGEGFGMVIIEAHSNGVPAVVYDCNSGPSDILQNDKGGFLVPMFARKEFLDRLISLIENPELRLEKSNEAYENATRYTVNAVLPRWEELFNSLIK